MRRRLLNLVTVLSLLLCAAAPAAWVQSYRGGAYWWRVDVGGDGEREATLTDWCLSSEDGRVAVGVRRWVCRPPSEFERRWLKSPLSASIWLVLQRRVEPSSVRNRVWTPTRAWWRRAWDDCWELGWKFEREDRPRSTTRRTWELTVPYGCLMLLAAAVPGGRAGAVLVRRRVRGRRLRDGRCAACGYDLRASPGRCPECGAGWAG